MSHRSPLSHDNPGSASPGMANVEKPFVTVITVSLNNLSGLKKTVQSVINQTYGGIEYIVVDGGSKDGSFDFLKNRTEYFDFWMSEPDKGIYDAMNKGIKKSMGEWIIFMNAGDVFYSETTVQRVAGKIDKSADMVFGSWLYRQVEFGNILLSKKPLGLDSLWRGMPFSHQASFVKSSLLSERPFNTDYKYCADYDFVYRLYSEKSKFQKIEEIIAVVASGGESDKCRAERRKEQRNISVKYDGKAAHESFLVFVLLVIRVWDFLKIYIPDKMLRGLYLLRHRRSVAYGQHNLSRPAGLVEEHIE